MAIKNQSSISVLLWEKPQYAHRVLSRFTQQHQVTPSQCLYCSFNSLCFQSMVSEPQTRTFTLNSSLSLFIFHLCFTGLWFTLSSTPSLFSSSGSRASNSEFHAEFNAFFAYFLDMVAVPQPYTFALKLTPSTCIIPATVPGLQPWTFTLNTAPSLFIFRL